MGQNGAVKILLVEDDRSIAGSVIDGLTAEGFEVTHAGNGADALAAHGYDMVLLDLGLPDMDGRDVCRQLRQRTAVPIIMLTARAEEFDRVLGLELGADDYITKPFSFRELVARIRAVGRYQIAVSNVAGTSQPWPCEPGGLTTDDGQLAHRGVEVLQVVDRGQVAGRQAEKTAAQPVPPVVPAGHALALEHRAQQRRGRLGDAGTGGEFGHRQARLDGVGKQDRIYRDVNTASLWAMQLPPRAAAPVLPSLLQADAPDEGAYYVQNVYERDPALPPHPSLPGHSAIRVPPSAIQCTTSASGSPRCATRSCAR